MNMPELLIIATRNAHKVEEIGALLGGRCVCRCLTDEPQAPDLTEHGVTFQENAISKATQLATWLAQTPDSPLLQGITSWAVLADDSGLEVDALNRAPGVHSARYASEELGLEGNAPDGANNAKLLRALGDRPLSERTARFRCVLALVQAGSEDAMEVVTFDGACEGRIGMEPKGTHGFGYDPLFVPDGFEISFAELGEAEKNRISHRSHAMAAFVQAFGGGKAS